MSTSSFTSLTTARLPSPSRLYPSSCCPDKDLVVLISRLGGIDRVSLWHSTQGSRIWEVEVGDGNAFRIINIAWSPDGQSIAVACDPPLISFHSVQDGRVTLTLPVYSNGAPQSNLTGIWWFRDETKPQHAPTIPDIFRRGDVITGSSQSLLQILPLLDNIQEDSENLTATDVFAFQGSHTRHKSRSNLPSVVATWPTLSIDPRSASIGPSSHLKASTEPALDEVDTSNIGSLLSVANQAGNVFFFLDGTFPLGSIALGLDLGFNSLVKHPTRPIFFGHAFLWDDGSNRTRTNITPTIIELSSLANRNSKDVATLSSVARELTWYTMRVIKEMREVWYGTDSTTGARDLGPSWIDILAQRQKEQFGQENPHPILDLTALLTTGRASEALTDFLGSGEHMSERSIQKWETTVTEALIKLRDFSEKRVAPALQRLHLVMTEIEGYSRLQQYSMFEFNIEEVTGCLHLTAQGIVLAGWLASVSRTELSRFRDFISWLRYEINNLNTSTSENSVPRYDLLEVNHYFGTSLTSSIIDKWFTGPLSCFQPTDLGILKHNNGSLSSVLDRVAESLTDPSKVAWFATNPTTDLTSLDRNMEILIERLAERCQRIFDRAAGAIGRSAIVSFNPSFYSKRNPEKSTSAMSLAFRERTIIVEESTVLQHIIARIPSENGQMLLLSRRTFSVGRSDPSEIGIALLQCQISEEGQEAADSFDIEVLESDFFDDETIIIIYRLKNEKKQTFISTANYNDVGYQNLNHSFDVMSPAREDLTHDAMEMWKTGQLQLSGLTLHHRRLLNGFQVGNISVALNGRKGRRIACVLDNTGTTLETIDLEGDEEDMEVADDGRM